MSFASFGSLPKGSGKAPKSLAGPILSNPSSPAPENMLGVIPPPPTSVSPPRQSLVVNIPYRVIAQNTLEPGVIAIVGKFARWSWGQHPDEAYLADTLEALGKRVIRIDQDGENGSPPGCEWVICTAQPRSYERIHAWHGARRLVLWTLDWLLHDSQRAPVIEAGRKTHIFATSDKYDWATHYGIGHHFYLPGACESAWPSFEPRPARTCAFVGTLYSDRRRQIAAVVQAMGGVVLDHPGAWVYGQDLARFVQDTKVIVGDNSTNDVPSYWSSRNYIIPGAGGFLLTSRVPEIEMQFSTEDHLGVYGSVDELPKKLAFWIANDHRREQIRRAGFTHVRQNHNWEVRARSLLRAMEQVARVA